MVTDNIIHFPQFSVGQLIHHIKFDYRGVIFEVDATFQGTEEWYEQMGITKPPKDKPWYHVMVHNENHTTYVAERNLELDIQSLPISHPKINEIFEEFDGKRYKRILN